MGGALGFALGGPLGALMGAALGHQLDKAATAEALGDYSRQERTQTAFFTTTFAVMGHLAKADGRVTPDEIALANRVMVELGLAPPLKRAARRLFDEGKNPGFPLDAVLSQFRRECHRSRNLLRIFLEIQFQAAYADGVVHPHERRVLEHIAETLGFTQHEYAQIENLARFGFAHHQAGAAPEAGVGRLDEAYGVLDVSEDASDTEVKRAYRRLMNQHHPDKLVSKGLPEEMMRAATEKTQEIKLAYEQIKRARGK